MNCPKCGAATAVIDSRQVFGTVRRRRECESCGHRFSTKEITQEQWEALREALKAARGLGALILKAEGGSLQ